MANQHISKEGLLAKAMMDFTVRAHSEGDFVVLRDMGIDHHLIQRILHTSANHHLILNLDWFPIESLSLPVMGRMLDFLEQAGASQNIQNQLLEAGAPKQMMRSWFDWSEQTFTQRCRALGVNSQIGRPSKPTRDQQADIEDAWARLMESGEVVPGHSDVMVRAHAWLKVSKEVDLPIRILFQSDPIDLPTECTILQFRAGNITKSDVMANNYRQPG